MRKVNEEELEGIRQGFLRFGVELPEAFKGKELFVSRQEVFLVAPQAAEILDTLAPYCAGLSIGRFRGQKFLLGLEGAYLISREAKNKVVVDPRGEQLSLYGRDIFINSVLKYPPLASGQECLIVNQNEEPLALGAFKGGRVFVKNLKDRGWYLRKGG